MRLFKLIALSLLMLPAAEIAAFIGIASLVGFARALALLIAMSLAGIVLLRRVGSGAVTRLRTTAGQVEMTSVDLDGSGIATALGAILLIIPGFITGLLGILVILPLTRNTPPRRTRRSPLGILVILPLTRKWLMVAFRRLLLSGQNRPRPLIVDLEPDEWHQLPGPKLPPHRRRPEA